MLMDASHRFYLRADGDRILASSLEDEPSVAEDARPTEGPVSRAIERVNAVTDLALGGPWDAWTGVRTLSADGLPVVGWDRESERVFWLAGQGGYGIQTSAGLAGAARDLILAETGHWTAEQVIDMASLDPSRITLQLA
jgi:D-arginine dehydrogenase